MLQPKKPKYRKQMKQVNHLNGTETRGCDLAFGDYGLKVLESGWITARQIEAGRVAVNRHMRRGGKLWIKVFPDKPLTSKPAEVRMGKGKGAPEQWVAEIRAGKLLYEVTGVAREIALGALNRAAAKIPLKCKVVARSGNLL